jgi:predicted nucleic acid-binding Zn ribbon protein
MVDKIPQHLHCQICGKAIAGTDETVCSEECKKRYQGLMKKRKMYVYIMYALIILILGLIVISNFKF